MEFVYATWFGHLTFLFFVGLTVLSEGAANAYAQVESARASRIHGSVKIGTIPLSGVRLSATNTVSGKKVITISDGSGTYSLTTRARGAI
jgi:trimeric autotransporter adhesin